MAGRAAIGLLLAGLVWACAPAPGDDLPTLAQERAIGALATEALVEGRGGRYDDPALTAYLEGLVARLLPHAGLDPGYGTPEVTVLDSADPNAFTVPGGALFVTRGMLALVRDEAELAAVLAHELGHVARRHSAESIASRDRMMREVARQAEDDLRLTGGARASRLRVIERALDARIGDLARYTRIQELQADRDAARILSAAGFPPGRMGSILGRMEAWQRREIDDAALEALRDGEPGRPPRSGYPAVAERLGALPEAAARPAPEGRDALMAAIDGMRWGEAFDAGYVRGGTFWQPGRTALAFDMPDGWLPVRAEGVTLLRGGAVILVGAEGRGAKLTTPFVGALRSPRAVFDSRREVEANGLRGREGAVTLDDGTSLRVRSVEGGGASQALVMIAPPGEEARARPAFRALADSLRVVAPATVPPPPRLRTRRAQPGETLATLAAAAPIADAEAVLRLLNGLEPGQRIAAGDWIKTVE